MAKDLDLAISSDQKANKRVSSMKPKKYLSRINVLLIDDDFAVAQPAFPVKYASLQEGDKPYRFLYESAFDNGRFTVEAALSAVRKTTDLAVLFLDIKFGQDSDRLGLKILAAVRAQFPLLPIIMLTSLDGDVDAIEEAMALGANEYLVKSPSIEELEQILRIYTQAGADETEFGIWGNAASVRVMRAQIARVAIAGSVTVLINGETGTGKELIARGVHRLGPRRTKPFVAKNCSHSDTQLLDAELFGQDRGSFTGAESRLGLVEQANGGVLFLDEIADMPLALQGKLLRLLETRTYRRVGASTERKADFQLVCATNQDLDELVRSGRLLKDLYYRINVITITAPPLRDRRDDIPLLAELFLRRFRRGPGGIYKAESFSKESLNALSSIAYSWPGNARQLRNIVEGCVTMTRATEIGLGDLPTAFQVPSKEHSFSGRSNTKQSATTDELRVNVGNDSLDLPFVLGKVELMAISDGLRITGGNKAKLMRLLYPGQPTHYYYRNIFNAIKKCPSLLDLFPEFADDYNRESQSRVSNSTKPENH